MTEQEQIEKSHAMAREWFRDHVATIDGVHINWRRPNTGNYAMTFTLFGRYVVVTGDVGEAIYGFGCEANPETLKKFDWHYFVHKCCASETGRNYTMKIPGIKSPVTNVRAIGHFVGLQMALKQLDL